MAQVVDLPEGTRWSVGDAALPAHGCRAIYATSFADLPQAVITIGGADPCRGDGVEYTSQLREAGVRVDLRDCPGLVQHAVMAPKGIPLARQVVDELSRTVGDLLRAAVITEPRTTMKAMQNDLEAR